MKKDPSLTYSGTILIDGVAYDRYEIISVEWNLQTNIFSVKVYYLNQSQSKSTTRTYPLEVGGNVSINEVIETIHQLHEKFKA